MATEVERLLVGTKPLLMATDPPYGVQYDSTWRAEFNHSTKTVRGTVANDGKSDWREVWALWSPQVLYVWHGALRALPSGLGIQESGYEIRSQIIWAKRVMILSRGAYHWKHEPCWYAVKKGENANWQGDRTQTTLWESGDTSSAGGTGDEADEFNAGHVTQKPVDLFRRPIINHTEKGDVVVEPFAGSGSQFVAAEQLGRLCYAMELEPKFVAVILERMSVMGLEPRLETQ